MRAKIIERICLTTLALLMVAVIVLGGIIYITYEPDTPREYTFLRQLVPKGTSPGTSPGVFIKASGYVVAYPDEVTITTEDYVYEK